MAVLVSFPEVKEKKNKAKVIDSLLIRKTDNKVSIYINTIVRVQFVVCNYNNSFKSSI